MTIRLAASLIVGLTCGIATADVTVSGKVKDSDSSPVPKVYIQAYREGPIFKEPKRSDDEGDYSVKVPAGDEFSLVFIDKVRKKYAEWRHIPGTEGKSHKHDVVLLTKDEFISKHGESRFEDLARRIRRDMPEVRLPKED